MTITDKTINIRATIPIKRKNVGYQDRKRNGFSWNHLLFWDCFRSHSTNVSGFKIHNPANPASKNKMIPEKMFRRIIQYLSRPCTIVNFYRKLSSGESQRPAVQTLEQTSIINPQSRGSHSRVDELTTIVYAAPDLR